MMQLFQTFFRRWQFVSKFSRLIYVSWFWDFAAKQKWMMQMDEKHWKLCRPGFCKRELYVSSERFSWRLLSLILAYLNHSESNSYIKPTFSCIQGCWVFICFFHLERDYTSLLWDRHIDNYANTIYALEIIRIALCFIQPIDGFNRSVGTCCYRCSKIKNSSYKVY